MAQKDTCMRSPCHSSSRNDTHDRPRGPSLGTARWEGEGLSRLLVALPAEPQESQHPSWPGGFAQPSAVPAPGPLLASPCVLVLVVAKRPRAAEPARHLPFLSAPQTPAPTPTTSSTPSTPPRPAP